jgi:hypothetical protein
LPASALGPPQVLWPAVNMPYCLIIDQYMLQWQLTLLLTTMYSQLNAGLTTNISGYKTTL